MCILLDLASLSTRHPVTMAAVMKSCSVFLPVGAIYVPSRQLSQDLSMNSHICLPGSPVSSRDDAFICRLCGLTGLSCHSLTWAQRVKAMFDHFGPTLDNNQLYELIDTYWEVRRTNVSRNCSYVSTVCTRLKCPMNG